jgi:hypothetical protein
MTTSRAITLTVLIASLVISQTVPAAETQATSQESQSWPGIGVGIKIGTLGLGADVTLPVIPKWLNLRASGNYLKYSYDGTADDIDYTFTLDFKDLMLLGDWHVFGNNFRLSAGAVWAGSSEVRLNGTPSDNVTIGDTEYTPEQVGTLNGELAFESVAPYVGIGFGNAIGPYEQTWSFVFDLGVIFQTFEATLSSDGPLANDPTFQANLKTEEDDLQDSMNQFKIYPVLQFGVAYHF